MGGQVGERHLVRAEGPFDLQAVDHLRPRPTLGRIQHDHRPARTRQVAVDAGILLDFLDLLHRRVERCGHGLVHQRRLVPLDKVRRPPIAAEQLFQFLMLDAGQDSRVGNLVAVQVQDRQHGAVRGRIEKLVGMPRRGQRTRLRLAVADDAGDHQIGVVQRRPERMAEGIAQFAALVDRAGAFRRRMAGDSARKGELSKELPQPGLILADIGIDLAVSALKISVADDGGAAVPGPGDVNHVEVEFLDDPVQMRVDEVLSRRRAPMPQQHALDVLQLQRLAKQGIVAEIDLADGEIIGGPPVGVHLPEQFRRQRFIRCGHRACIHARLPFQL